ncbi:c-type cytochrome [Microvirga ossetica]|nr:cytochrome c [Microvirga ossetica]
MGFIRHSSKAMVLVKTLIFMGFVTRVVAADVEDDEVQQGRRLVEAHCASCHAVRRKGESPVRQALPFRDLERRYPAESLAEALAEGLGDAHADVATFEAEDVDRIITYLRSLAR